MKDLKRICDILKINEPAIVYTDEKKYFSSSTTMAAMECGANEIYINKNYLPGTDFDLLFCIAHECRHLWQVNNSKVDYKKYRSSNFLSKTEYNNQIEELDAHAFACAYLKKYHKIIPLFNGLEDSVKNLIYAMADEIELE